LIELIIVMTLLVIALGVTFPALQSFFRGRTLDSEARRFLSLTRYGQSRAVSEGVPMVLWIDAREGAYGLQAQAGFLDLDSRAVEFEVDDDIIVEVSAPPLTTPSGQRQINTRLTGNLPIIQFTPDGFIGETSPEQILFREGQDYAVAVALTANRLNYEIQANERPNVRR
jgi:Tfp pilus assembly protein FimT